jgi:hypothetical protein
MSLTVATCLDRFVCGVRLFCGLCDGILGDA